MTYGRKKACKLFCKADKQGWRARRLGCKAAWPRPGPTALELDPHYAARRPEIYPRQFPFGMVHDRMIAKHDN
jgi:hypothetical protein